MNRRATSWSWPLCATLLLGGCLGDVPMHDSGVRITSDLGPTDLVHPNKDYPNFALDNRLELFRVLAGIDTIN